MKIKTRSSFCSNRAISEDNVQGSTQSPTEDFISLQILIPYNATSREIKSTLQLANQTVQSLRDLNMITKKGLLSTLIIDICSIIGILFHLEQLVRNAASDDRWIATKRMLSTWPGPLEQYTTNLGLLPTTYAPNVRQKVVSEALRPRDWKVDIVELKITIERHKLVLVHYS